MRAEILLRTLSCALSVAEGRSQRVRKRLKRVARPEGTRPNAFRFHKIQLVSLG